MVINETIQVTRTVIEAKAAAYPVSLISLWLIIFISMPFIAMASKNRGEGWGHFWCIWAWTAAISGLILIGFLIAPSWVANSWDVIVKLFT